MTAAYNSCSGNSSRVRKRYFFLKKKINFALDLSLIWRLTKSMPSLRSQPLPVAAIICWHGSVACRGDDTRCCGHDNSVSNKSILQRIAVEQLAIASFIVVLFYPAQFNHFNARCRWCATCHWICCGPEQRQASLLEIRAMAFDLPPPYTAGSSSQNYFSSTTLTLAVSASEMPILWFKCLQEQSQEPPVEAA